MSIIFVLLQGWIAFPPDLEISVFEKYFEFSRFHIILLLSIPFVIYGVVYKVLEPFHWKPSGQIALLQIGLSLVSVVIFAIVGRNSKTMAGREIANDEVINNMIQLNQSFTQVTLIFFTISILLFLLLVVSNLIMTKVE